MDDVDSDRHIVTPFVGDVVMDLIANDGLGGGPKSELIDGCLYLALLV